MLALLQPHEGQEGPGARSQALLLQFWSQGPWRHSGWPFGSKMTPGYVASSHCWLHTQVGQSWRGCCIFWFRLSDCCPAVVAVGRAACHTAMPLRELGGPAGGHQGPAAPPVRPSSDFTTECPREGCGLYPVLPSPHPHAGYPAEGGFSIQSMVMGYQCSEESAWDLWAACQVAGLWTAHIWG